MIIPIEMCFYALSKKFVSPFQLYLYLKVHSSGKIKLDSPKLGEIARDLGFKSVKTIRNNLKKLKDEGWIGYNKKSGYYFIRGFDIIRKQKKFTRRTGVEIRVTEIKDIKAFSCGAVIGYLINIQKRKKWMLERKKARSRQSKRFSSSFYPISSWVLAKILNISTSTAHKYKQLAKRANYISVKKSIKATGIHVSNIRHIKKYYPEIGYKIRVKNNQLYIQGVDRISHNFYFKRRKKIESL